MLDLEELPAYETSSEEEEENQNGQSETRQDESQITIPYNLKGKEDRSESSKIEDHYEENDPDAAAQYKQSLKYISEFYEKYQDKPEDKESYSEVE